ncbi:MAG: SRPBCC family protein [Anaerolineae bacterium]
MFQIESSITINKPIDEVFTFISDNENDPKWCVPVVETTRVVGDAPGANTRYTFASKADLFMLRGEFTILEFEPPIRVTWEGTSSVNRFSGAYSLEASEGGTLLTESATLEAKWFLRLMESSMSRQVEASVVKQLQLLKHLLEN